MKKRNTVSKTLIITCIVVIIVGSVWGIKLHCKKVDLQWQAAKEIYRVHTAIQELDENWELESLSEVHPYEIKSPDGSSIFYYCCVTSYLNGNSVEIDGINKVALSQVIDVDSLENSVVCDINGSQGILGEIGNKKYLCWTISSTYSCILEYTKETISEEEIIRIAESVNNPEK